MQGPTIHRPYGTAENPLLRPKGLEVPFVDGFQAIVVVERPRKHGTQLRHTSSHRNTVAYAFNSFAPALAFMRATKVDAVVVEFDIEVETMDFCDAAKALKVPIIFSANGLEPHDLAQYGLSASDVIYPARTIDRRAS
jgi:hypothetical protein